MANNKENELDKQDSAEVKNYTRTPNMLIFGYNNISPQEKWLYVCLKHMCGKRGTRHLSLRYISEQTGISVGALSKSKDKKGNINEGMIKHLHDAELIHAEIKKLNGKGNPLYHITITDVWGLNQAFFTRPNSEQDENEENEPVRNSDVPVQNSDKLARNSDKPVQISDEPVRKPLQYQDYIQDYKQDDNNTREDESNSDDTTKPPVVSSDTARANSLQDEKMFTDEKLQGDDHATVPASGHPDRVGDVAAPGVGYSHHDQNGARLVVSDTRPGLEAQEKITEGEHHANRVPPLPATDYPASSERAVSRHDTDHSHRPSVLADEFPAVRAVGSGTPGQEAGRDTRDAGRDTTQTLAQTPTTPTPAQSLSPFPQAEQAASGMTFVEARDYLRSLGYFLEPTPSRNGNWEIREPHENGFSVIKGDEVRRIAEYQREKHADLNGGITAFQEPVKPNENADQKTGKQSTKAEKRTGKAEPVKPEFTPEGEALYRDWCSLFHVTIPKTKAITLAANELAEPITIWAEQKLGISKAEVLKRIMNWLYKNNPNYYGEGRGVKLYDIHRDFEEWQSAAERKLAKDALKVVVSPIEDKSRIFSMEPIILPSRTHKGGLRGKAVATTH